MTTEERTIQREGRTFSIGVSGSGPDLVVLHSLLTDRHSFDDVLPVLAADYTVHLVDLPGFGATSHAEADLLAYGQLIATYLRGLDAPATVMGNGLGGFIAIATAIAEPSRVARLVIVGAGPGFDDQQRQAFTAMAERAGQLGMVGVVEVAVRRIFSEAFLESHPEHHEQRRAVLLETPVDAFRTACHALHGADLTDSIPSLEMPTLIVVGSDDQATPPSMARDLHALLPNSELIELPGVAHGPQIQQPRAFLAAIGEFLGISEPV